MINNTFKKSKIATTLSVLLGATVLPLSVSAAESAEAAVEVITVTGMRSSIQESTRLKRDAEGVVDAISAEDIGKFPDTNLAESLQRITGVSISRNNGEGSQVTVRGFGADKNMVTLNGRTMPAAGAFGNDQGTSRAFDFANLASESVSSLEVYKTGKAKISSGGIGATININTKKPLAREAGLIASIGAKALADTTNRTGNDITPELSGLISFADDDNTFGISLTVSHQQRDSGSSSVAVNDWRIQEWDSAAQANNDLLAMTDTGTISNAPADGQLFGTPNDVNFHFSDNERTRNNAQLTVQFRPTDQLLATVDYTYANLSLREHYGDKGHWMTRTYDNIVFDTDQEIATAVIVSEDLNGTKDTAFAQTLREQDNTLKSLGLNLQYEVNDELTLSLDAHSSKQESLPDTLTGGSAINIAMAGPVGDYQTADFRTELPSIYDVVNIDNVVVDNATGNLNGNNNGVFDQGDIGSQVLRIFYTSQETEINQIRFDGSYEFDNGRFDFGVETSELEMQQRYSENYMALGDWGVNNPRDVPTELLEDFNVMAEFDDYDTSKSDQIGFKGDPAALGKWAADAYDYDYTYNKDFSENHNVKEDTFAFYGQVSVQAELGGRPINVLAGLRYEETDVTSTSNILEPTALVWKDNNDYELLRASEKTANTVESSYDHFLPSLDFDIELTDDLKARASFGQTISRANYDQLRAGVSGIGSNGPSLTGGAANATASNPALVPLHSSNIDLSLEWYFDDTSYVSGGFYEKRVKNFIGTEQVPETQFGLRDVTAGPRAQAAADALADLGEAVTETSLFVMTAVLDNPSAFPNGAADYKNDVQDPTFAAAVAGEYDLVANSSDPEYQFLTSKPVNNKEAKIYGFELAAQHFFGDTGFGVQGNYTIVRGDVGFDDNGSTTVSQFALTGLSDTANLVALYEKDGIQARIAYNWRDEYLNETSRGSYKNPRYIEAFSQIDFSVSYEINESLTVSFEGLNITEENSRSHGRSPRQIWDLYDLGSRYALSARYSF